MIDTNVYLSRWPFRRLKHDDTPALVKKLKSHGVTQAWAGSFDALLHKDIGRVNAQLAEECRTHGADFLIPFGAVNPRLPDWEEDLRRCHEEYKMPGIRLHPNFHGYKPDDPLLAKVLQLAAERKLLVQLAILMEDARTQHPLLPMPPVEHLLLPDVIKAVPGLRIQLLNAFQTIRAKPLLDLMAAGEVSFEIATLEGIGGIGNLLAQLPLNRICFGSYAPFFSFESAELKMKESALSDARRAAILDENAKKLLAR